MKISPEEASLLRVKNDFYELKNDNQTNLKNIVNIISGRKKMYKK